MLKCFSKPQTIARKYNDGFDHKIILKTKNETIKLMSNITNSTIFNVKKTIETGTKICKRHLQKKKYK